jgi:hypothetical protein
MSEFILGPGIYIYRLPDGTIYMGPIPPPEDPDAPTLVVTAVDRENGTITLGFKE